MNKPQSNTTPILVRGMSRSGGTLLTSIFDAHPDIAMSYELYPNLLKNDLFDADYLLKMAATLERLTSLKSVSKELPAGSFRTFVLRAYRSGVDHLDVAKLIREYLHEGGSFADPAGRLRFISQCCMLKMERSGKNCWGVKCSPHFDEYLDVWPDAKFVNIIRDGRDVLASQLNTGSFQVTPGEVGQKWAANHREFRRLVERDGVTAVEVSYERLANRPEQAIREMCSALGIDFQPSMETFHQQDMTLFENPVGHLSYNQLTHGINASSVGRWKRELTDDHIKEFLETARETMRELGYL